jgi:hypothetical protein
MDPLNTKAMARSKHKSSLTKDKNRYKKKVEHIKKAIAEGQIAPKRMYKYFQIYFRTAKKYDYVDPQYRRRKVVSNAYKFEKEMKVDDDESTMYKLDLSKLLQETSIISINSNDKVSKNQYQHFQFQLEKEWEDDIQTSGNVVLPIDHVCQILSKLPLSSRLQLDPSYFVNLLILFTFPANRR